MMQDYSLRSGLSFCHVAGATIFLDLPADKYRMLGPALVDAFSRFTDGEYLSQAELARLESAGIIERGNEGTRPTPASISPAVDQHPAALRGTFRLWPTLSAVWAVHREQRLLRLHGLSAAVADMRKACLFVGDQGNGQRAHSLLRAFEHCRYWQSSSELCLSRSFALAKALSAHSVSARVVLGVRLDPFRAHCWVQAGGLVLNDSAEEVAKFTPILVL